MKKSDIINFRNNHFAGERLKVPKITTNDKFDMVSAELLELYPYHCLVQDTTDPKYKWSVKWIDLMMLGVK
jgi:hypothetical protein